MSAEEKTESSQETGNVQSMEEKPQQKEPEVKPIKNNQGLRSESYFPEAEVQALFKKIKSQPISRPIILPVEDKLQPAEEKEVKIQPVIQSVKTVEAAKPWRNPVLDEYTKNGRKTVIVRDDDYSKWNEQDFKSFNVKSESQHNRDQQREIEETRIRDEETRIRNKETHIRNEETRKRNEETRRKEQKYQEDMRDVEVRRANLEISQAEQDLEDRRLGRISSELTESEEGGDEDGDENGEDEFDADEFEDLEDDE